MGKFLIMLSSIILCGLSAAGQAPSRGMLVQSDDSFLEQLQKRDSVLVGDQLRYGFHLKSVPQGTLLVPATDFSKGFMPGDSVIIVRPWAADTVKVHGKKGGPQSHDIDISLIITSFEEGSYLLTPLSVFRRTAENRLDTLVFKPQPLEVHTMPVDTTTYRIHDIKGQVKYPFTLAEILPYVLGIWALAIVAILVWALVASRRKRGAEGPAHKDPPYLVALRKLDRYRGSKYWAHDKQKAFYSGITDALREYIDSRYGIDAPEMTTAELFDSLRQTDLPADIYMEMEGLFELADLVKFAKAFATDEENAAAVPSAVRFVTSTYQSQLAAEGTQVGGAATAASPAAGPGTANGTANGDPGTDNNGGGTE